MKFKSTSQKAFVNDETHIIFFTKLSITAAPKSEAAHPNSFREKLQSQLKDLGEIVKEAERTKKEIEIEINKLNQKTMF